MHIPDGFLDLKTCVGSLSVASAGFALAMRRVNASRSDRTVPLLGVMSAFLFAGQTVNFPIPGGISGHLLGCTLAAIVLGPGGAALVLATVLFVQCLLFQDGGITAFPANFLNLGLVGVGVGYSVFRGMRRWLPASLGVIGPAAIASWCSVVAASVACAVELAGSGVVSLKIILPPMVIVHAVIGVGEALITAAMLSFLVKVRPDLIYAPDGRAAAALMTKGRVWSNALAGLAVAIGIGLLITPFSSPLPDGLEALAEKFDFQDRARAIWPAPMADYSFPGTAAEWLSVSLAVICGAVLTFVLVWSLARWTRRPRTQSNAD